MSDPSMSTAIFMPTIQFAHRALTNTKRTSQTARFIRAFYAFARERDFGTVCALQNVAQNGAGRGAWHGKCFE
jgi:hypothetical protein